VGLGALAIAVYPTLGRRWRGRLPATRVAFAVMPKTGAETLLAWWVLNETPPPTAVEGGASVVLGVYLALRP